MGFWKRITGLFSNGGLDSLDILNSAPQTSQTLPAKIAVAMEEDIDSISLNRDGKGISTLETHECVGEVSWAPASRCDVVATAKLPKVLQFRVTSKDIRKGVPGDPAVCPVAIAACRKLGLNVPEVCATTIHICVAGSAFSDSGKYHNTKKLSNYIRAFDRGEKIKPETFTLRLAK